MADKYEAYELPTIPFSPIDLINRRAAATGSMTYAMLTGSADYNGHRVSVSFKDKAVCGPVWNAEFYWGERMVLGRGSFAHCLDAALAYYKQGHKGAHVVIGLSPLAPEPLEEQRRLVLAAGGVPYSYDGSEAKPSWWSGKHEAVSDALHWHGNLHHILMEAALAFEGQPAEWAAHRDALVKGAIQAKHKAWQESVSNGREVL